MVPARSLGRLSVKASPTGMTPSPNGESGPGRLSFFAMAAPFLLEQQVAIAAVRRACSLTATVFNKLVVGETLVKGDKSPVTGARGPPVAFVVVVENLVGTAPSTLLLSHFLSGRLCCTGSHQYRSIARVPR